MAGYQKGTTPTSELERLEQAFATACAAIYAWPDASEAWKAANDLGNLIRRLQGQSADFRGYLAAYLADYHGLTVTELATFFGISRPATSNLLKRARAKGNPVIDPTSMPEQPNVVLAIITSDQGVLVAHRVDRIPPWTFPGGEIRPGESSGDAVRRRVHEETGVDVFSTVFIGRRIHPKTSRVMVYVHATVNSTEVTLGDPEDLDEVRWAPIDETRELMPDMYPPVRQYLDQLQQAQQADAQ